MSTLSALNEQRDNRALTEMVYKTYNNLDIEKVTPRMRDMVKIVKHVSNALLNEDNVFAADLNEVIEESKFRENNHSIEEAKLALTHKIDSSRVNTVMENYETFLQSLVINEHLPNLIDLSAQGSSIVDMPRTIKAMNELIGVMNTALKKEVYAKGHSEFTLIPGENPKGLAEIRNAIVKEKEYTLYTGIAGIDEIILNGGISPGKFTIIGSYAGGGKSIGMFDFLKGTMKCEKNRRILELPGMANKRPVVMLITYENTMLQTYRRFMKLWGFNSEFLNSLSLAELTKLMTDIVNSCPIGLIIKAADAKTETAEMIGNYIREKEDQGIHVLIVGHDYINLTNANSAGDKNSNEFMEAGLVAQELREVICKGLNKPLLSAVQVRKEAEDRYIESVKKGDKMPIRVFNGSSIFGGNVTKQKADNFIFVVYSILQGQPYAEFMLDKARDGHGMRDDVSMQVKMSAHLKDYFDRQDMLYTSVTEERSIKEFYGNDGRLAVAIPRHGLMLNRDEYYADRYEVNPEASKFMNMFEEKDIKDEEVIDDDGANYEVEVVRADEFEQQVKEHPELLEEVA